eukprot:UN12180
MKMMANMIVEGGIYILLASDHTVNFIVYSVDIFGAFTISDHYILDEVAVELKIAKVNVRFIEMERDRSESGFKTKMMAIKDVYAIIDTKLSDMIERKLRQQIESDESETA